VRLGVFGAFGFEWFDIVVPHFVLHLLLVNFSWIVSASGCRHILPNHLNLGVFVETESRDRASPFEEEERLLQNHIHPFYRFD
jgi:hypothetical protein